MIPTADNTTVSEGVAPISKVSDVIVHYLLYLCFVLFRRVCNVVPERIEYYLVVWT